uniref:Uncharacterized protein n=1 Tax=Panagrellus redivivus TaxID=6233 RepID=A0A7E4UNU9_PANRE
MPCRPSPSQQAVRSNVEVARPIAIASGPPLAHEEVSHSVSPSHLIVGPLEARQMVTRGRAKTKSRKE